MEAARSQARAEIALCEAVLAKSGLSVLTETLVGVSELSAYAHYPDGDVYDPQSGAQWYYHCHPAEEGTDEHGHFHCFVRPAGPDGPIHHLVAIGVSALGQPLRLFTVNRWVVDDDWVHAETLLPLLERFDVQMPRPSYLVNRWLTAMLAAHEAEIADLLRARDGRLAQAGGEPALADRGLEVLSECRLDVADQGRA